MAKKNTSNPAETILVFYSRIEIIAFIVQASVFLIFTVRVILDVISDRWHNYKQSIGLVVILFAFFLTLLVMAFQCYRTGRCSQGLSVTIQILLLPVAVSLWQAHHIFLSLVVLLSLCFIVLGVLIGIFAAK